MLSFPRDDALFRGALDRLGLVTMARGDVPAARRLLRRTYPGADLHRQPRVVVGAKEKVVWFAFRDGRRAPDLPFEPWWERRDVASCEVDLRGCLLGANRQARSLLGLPTGGPCAELARLVGSDQADQLTGIGDQLDESGEVTSVIPFQLPWGRPQQLEIHVARDGVGPGRHQASFRSMNERADDNEARAVRKASLRLASVTARTAALRGRSRRTLEPGERLAEGISGDPWVVLVAAGIVRSYANIEGREPTVSYAADGAILGTRWMSTEDAASVGLQAVTPSVVVKLDPRRIDELIAADPEVAKAILADSRELAGGLVLSFLSAVATNFMQRLAREIVVLADLQPNEPYLAVTEQQLADSLGSVRESVARTLGAMRRRSWLATTRYGLLVLDPTALRDLARLAVAPADRADDQAAAREPPDRETVSLGAAPRSRNATTSSVIPDTIA